MTTGHLVADRQLPLDGQVDLDQLDHAGRQLVALGQLGDLVRVLGLDGVDVLLAHPGQLLDLLLGLAVALDHLDLGPVLVGDLGQHLDRDLLALGQEHLALVVDQARRGGLADQELLHLRVVGLGDDLDLVLLVAVELLGLGLLDGGRALVLVGALAREHAGADDHAGHARGHAQRGVADVAGLLAEDGAEQLLLGGELGLALGRDLADQDVAGLDLGADPDDARVVEVG